MRRRRRRRLSRFGKLVFSCLFVVIASISLLIYFKVRPLVILKTDKITLEVNEAFEPTEYIKKVRKVKIEDVEIENPVEMNKPGEYTVLFKVKKKKTKLEVTIQDTVAPWFDVVHGSTNCDVVPNAENLVTTVIEQSPYEVYLKEDYDFSHEGEIEVVVVVEDASHNKTEKTTMVTILPPDKIKPEIEGDDEIYSVLYGTCDPLIGVYISDNIDEHPTLKIKESNVDTTKVGTYEVTLEGSDQAGNTTLFKRKVHIVKDGVIGSESSDHNDVIFLTFDDGPSYNTPKILEILKEYDVKATFFVTGFRPDEYKYVKQAYDEGHTIALHSYTHVYADIYSDESAYFEDLERLGELVEEYIGFAPHYIRFPGGSSNSIEGTKDGIMTSLTQQVIDHGYQYYDWNLSSEDASGNMVPKDRLVKAATNDDNGNIILLCHDGVEKDTTVEALPEIIQYYKNLGFRFAAISDQSYTCHHSVYN